MQVPAIFSKANRMKSTARGEAMIKLGVMMKIPNGINNVIQ